MTTTRISNLDERVRESLRDQIMSGSLQGGAHLSELKISKEFNVSRTPVREALCALQADGLIEMIPHRGAFVKEINETTVTDQRYIYSTLLATAAGLAAQKANIEMLMEVEAGLSDLSGKSGTAFVAGLVDVLKKIRMSAQSGTIDELTGLMERRIHFADDFKPAATNTDAVVTALTTTMSAIKRNKAEVAEKAMREAVQLAFGQNG